jgi:hypothetical protein
MSIAVMTRVWSHSKHKGNRLLILLALADHADDDGYCWPSVDTLAVKSRCSRRTVQEVLRELEQTEEIEIAPNAGPKGTNLYQVTAYMGGAKSAPRGSGASRGAESSSAGVRNRDANLRPNHKEPSLKPSTETSEAEQPKSSHPAIQAYRDAAHYYPPKSWWGDVIEAVGESDDEVKRWGTVVKKWVGKGWAPKNVEGMLDVFRNGWQDNRSGQLGAHVQDAAADVAAFNRSKGKSQ